jgi:HAD superfamily hydrolase (TIGR01509 family)
MDYMIRAIIFDFDGLILDTESPVYHSWRELYQSFGASLSFEEWGSIIGTSSLEHFDPFDKLEEQLGRSLDRASLDAERYRRELEMLAEEALLPGVQEYLVQARGLGLRLGVASSSSREWVVGHLKDRDLLGYFDVVHTADDVERTKPDPALFLLTLESLGVEAGEAFVLEDSPNGVTAAQRAGVFCVAVPNALTRLLSLDHADLRLESLTDLPLAELVARVERAA